MFKPTKLLHQLLTHTFAPITDNCRVFPPYSILYQGLRTVVDVPTVAALFEDARQPVRQLFVRVQAWPQFIFTNKHTNIATAEGAPEKRRGTGTVLAHRICETRARKS